MKDAELKPRVRGRWETNSNSPVVHARWKGGIVTSLHCSNCGETALGTCFEEEFMSKYCPNCGAKMDESEDKK